MINLAYQFQLSAKLFSESVTAFHFGTAFENRGQTITPGSPVVEVLNQLPIVVLRYPGGTQTEGHFDPSDPNNARPLNIFTGQPASFVPISEFIEFVEGEKIKPVFVIPTFRYFEKSSSDEKFLSEASKMTIFSFVRDVVSGVYGETTVAAFEIGNEWFNEKYLHHPIYNPNGWTPAEFGILQGEIAKIVEDAIKSVGTLEAPSIWVQSSQLGDPDIDNNGKSDNREILAGIPDQLLRDIDGVVDHFYQPTRSATPIEAMASEGWVASTRIARLIADGWNVSGAHSLDIVATEWNVRAARNGFLTGDDANITGLERLPIFLGLFANMIESGVDIALAFTAQAMGPSAGSGTLSLFGSTALTPTGMLFDMMGRSLLGTKLVDPNGDGVLSADEYIISAPNGEGCAVTYTFRREDRTVVYFASGVGTTINLTVNGFEYLPRAGYSYEIKSIVASDGEDPLSASVTTRILARTIDTIGAMALGDGVLNIKLRPYELIQIVATYDPRIDQSQLNPISTSGTVRNDRSLGTGGDDSLRGGIGNDFLNGRNGNDYLFGGVGSDFIYGEAGSDIIFGGHGSDKIHGGSGNDTMDGGNGSDRIFGATGRDRIWGGSKRDSIYGGSGNDVLYGEGGNDSISGGGGNDVVYAGVGNDFVFGERGNDTLYGFHGCDRLFGGKGDDKLTGASGDDFLWGGNGVDSISGGRGADRLYGGTGNDTLDGGAGADALFGGAGTDTATYASATAAVTADLTNASANTGHAAGDTYSSIENLIGSNFGDTLRGNTSNNALTGNGGNDILSGEAGNDNLFGGVGDDQLYGGTGLDALYASDGFDLLMAGDDDDTLDGGTGNDTILGQNGADRLTGRLGDDLFRYQNAAQGGDFITDFSNTTGNNDRFSINASGFGGGLVGGSLSASQFVLRSTNTNAALDANDRFIYNTVTNTLWFDVDGTGSQAAVLIATLQSDAPDVTASDIWLFT